MGIAGGEESGRWIDYLRRRVWGNPVRARVEVGDGGRGDTPGTQAELLRRLLVTEEAWACGTMAAQRFCTSNGEAEVRVRGGCGMGGDAERPWVV